MSLPGIAFANFPTVEATVAAQVSANLGPHGIVTLASVTGQPATFGATRTGGVVRKIDGPVMCQREYFAPSATPDICVWWTVRYYTTGAAEIETVVTNGWANSTPPIDRTYSFTLTVQNIVAAVTVTHVPRTRFSRVDWFGTDPNCHVTDNGMAAAKIFPNYGQPDPPAATVTGLVASTREDALRPVPFDRGPWRIGWPNGGEAASDMWGLNNFPTAVYAQTGAVQAEHAAIAADRMFGRYAFDYTDVTTGENAIPQDYIYTGLPQNAGMYYGNGGNNTTFVPASVPPYALVVDQAHQPQVGTGAMITGWPSLQDQVINLNAFNVFAQQRDERQGVRSVLARDQARGRAWSLRTLAHAHIVCPDDHPHKLQLLTQLEGNIDALYEEHLLHPNNLGVFIDAGAYSDENEPGENTDFDTSSFQLAFFSMTLAYIYFLKPSVSAGHLAKLKTLAMRALSAQVGLVNAFREYSSIYTVELGTGSNSFPPPVWYGSWDQVFEESKPDGQATTNTPVTAAFKFGWTVSNVPSQNDQYIAKLRPCIAYAVDLGVPGAQLAWDRITQSASPGSMELDPRYNIAPV